MGIDHTAKLHHPDREQLALPDVLHALSDPQRLQIVRELAASEGAMPCGSIAVGVTKSTMTHHYRVLREAGAVRQERVGTAKLTSLRREDLEARFPGLLEAILAAEPVGA